MTAPRRYAVSEPAGLLLRIIAVAATIAMLVAGFLCIDHVTTARVATGLIGGAVALACLIIV
jgi:hypothetical protein